MNKFIILHEAGVNAYFNVDHIVRFLASATKSGTIIEMTNNTYSDPLRYVEESPEEILSLINGR